jgi:hypothetical protein
LVPAPGVGSGSGPDTASKGILTRDELADPYRLASLSAQVAGDRSNIRLIVDNERSKIGP